MVPAKCTLPFACPVRPRRTPMFLCPPCVRCTPNLLSCCWSSSSHCYLAIPALRVGAPYLSIQAWVRQICVVCGPPPNGSAAGGTACCGERRLLPCLRACYLPQSRLALPCPQAKIAIANRQQLIVIQIRDLRIESPIFDCANRAAPYYQCRDCARSETFTIRHWPRRAGKRNLLRLRRGSTARGTDVSQRQQRAGHAVGGVAHHALFAGEVAGDAAHAQRLDALDVGHDRRCALGRVARQRLRRERRRIHQRVVEDRRAGVLVDALDVLGCRQAQALVGLRSSGCRIRRAPRAR